MFSKATHRSRCSPDRHASPRQDCALISLIALVASLGCSGSAPTPEGQSGGTTSLGGVPAVGGNPSTTAGNPATGGRANVSGAAGSSAGTGGLAAGGAPASATGGSAPAGGSPTGGGGAAFGGNHTTGGAFAGGNGPTAGTGGAAGSGDAATGGGGSPALGGQSGRAGAGGSPSNGGAGQSTGGTGIYVPCAAGTACVILPLGDSITEGCCTQPMGGYRIELFTKAVNAKQNITFVGGTLTIGDAAPNGPATVAGQPFPKGNEGNGGYTIANPSTKGGIAGAITDQSLSTYKPNIVLLMIGTNDILQNIDLANAPARLSSLIDEIITGAPSALLVVSSIPPCCNDATVQAYNATIPDLVKSRAQAGKHVLFVDAHAAFVKDANYKSDYISSDGLHPSSNGYAVIGDVFYGAISSVLP
jgi:lysophospholipase L1-like esterase